jgi:pyruvate formate-lyase activating enzyme-like uncharacterized protein
LESIHLYFSKTASSKNARKQLRETIGQEIRVKKINKSEMREKTIFSHVVGKKFGPKQGEVTLGWT